MMKTLTTAFLPTILVAVLNSSAANPIAKLFWAGGNHTAARQVRCATAAGQNVQTIKDSLMLTEGVVVDPRTSRVYFSDPLARRIYVSDAAGSNLAELWTPEKEPNLGTPYSMAIDSDAGKLYWTDLRNILRSNVDGSGAVETVLTVTGGDAWGLAIDHAAGKIYWTDCCSRIRRANLDGSSGEDVVTERSFITKIALDPQRGKIYWTDAGIDKIQRADLDGLNQNIEDIVPSVADPVGIAIDSINEKLYFTTDADGDDPGGAILKTRLDGIGPITTVVAEAPNVREIAILPEPFVSSNLVLRVDGGSDYVTVPSSPDLQNPDEITMEAWIYPVANRNNHNPHFISKGDGLNVSSSRSYELTWVGDQLIANVFLSSSMLAVVAAPAPSNQWVHVAISYHSGEGVLRLYTNGLLAASTTRDASGTFTLQGNRLRQTTHPLIFGANPPHPRTFATAFMDEIRIWDVARSPYDVLRNTHCRLTAHANLVGHWNFDSATANDSAGSHDGTFIGGAAAVPMTGEDVIHGGDCPMLFRTFPLSATTPGGGIVVPEPLLAGYPSNTVVKLTARPANGWFFLGWMGDLAGAEPVTTMRMTKATCVQALFGTRLTSSTTGNGALTVLPQAEFYPYGTSVRLIAQPQEGYFFSTWAGSVTGEANPRSFSVVDANPTVTAVFSPLSAGEYSLVVVPAGNGRVNVSPRANRYPAGATVTLTVFPDPQQTFSGWSGDASGTQNPLVISMNESKTITAQFSRRPRLNVVKCMGHLDPTHFHLTISGQIGDSYLVEQSADLISWSPFKRVANDFGSVEVAYNYITNGPHGFFRAVQEAVTDETLTTLWTEPITGGQVEVTSFVNAARTTWRYTVRNISYNPPGGDGNYGIQGFNLRRYNYPVPEFLNAVSPSGWTRIDEPAVSNWFRNTVGPEISPTDPNRPNVGLMPGQSAVFGFSLDTSATNYALVQLEGTISSSSHTSTTQIVGTYEAHGLLLYPQASP